MPLVLFYTKRVREALKAPTGLVADLVFLLFAGSIIGLLVMMGRRVSTPYTPTTVISLSLWVLPKYTLMSLSRGFAAYFLSLIFTLVYGTIAAHNRRAEKVMVPALDVLQAIPVLGFLPGLVLAMVRLFPTSELGLELACVIMIFTAQVWNMTFSFHGSLRGIPQPLREVAAIQRLGGWKTFRLLEVPAAMIGLVWNSMMSMAGGWFFLTVNEAFTLGKNDYRLPGIGSYMQQAINDYNVPAMLAAIVAMVVMIVAVDQIFWQPIVVWSQRFRMEDLAQSGERESWMLNLLRRSRVFQRFTALFKRRARAREAVPLQMLSPIDAPSRTGPTLEYVQGSAKPQAETTGAGSIIAMALKWIVLGLILVGALWGAWELFKLLIALPFYERSGPKAIYDHEDWLAVVMALGASFLRTTAAVAIGAAWALPAGIMIGLSPRWSAKLQPIIQVVASFPAPMLFPLVTLALIKLDVPFTAGCVALMLLGAQWYILFNVIAGASAIPHDLREVCDVYRMSRWERWKRLYLPCTFPYLVTGLVTAAGGAWNATIVSEYVQLKGNTLSAFGLGSTISKATANGSFSLLAAGVVTMAVFVVLINRFFWKRMYRLAEERYSLNV
jgi:NitT/TauT family transport system permease protein